MVLENKVNYQCIQENFLPQMMCLHPERSFCPAWGISWNGQNCDNPKFVKKYLLDLMSLSYLPVVQCTQIVQSVSVLGSIGEAVHYTLTWQRKQTSDSDVNPLSAEGAKNKNPQQPGHSLTVNLSLMVSFVKKIACFTAHDIGNLTGSNGLKRSVLALCNNGTLTLNLMEI